MATSSVLSAISQEYEALAGSVHMDGGVFGKEGSFTLREIKGLLLSRDTPGVMRDLIWRDVICSVRSEAGAWSTIAIGMAMPGLTNLARQFTRDYPEANPEDICGEIVAGFLEALHSVDIERPAILTRVHWATYRAVRRSAYAEALASKAACAGATQQGPAPEAGHPDLVLARLIEEKVVTAAEADLISAVRLDRRPLADAAEVLGISTNAVLLRLRQAEMRVAARLTDTAVTSRRAFKQGRKGEARLTSDSFGPVSRTSVGEEPLGALAARGGSDEGRAR